MRPLESPRRPGWLVQDFGIGGDRASISMLASSQLKVNVLEIDCERLVQESYLVEHLPSDQHERSLDRIDRLAPDGDMLRQAAANPPNARRTDALRTCPPLDRPDEPDPRVRLRQADHAANRPRRHDDAGIREQDEVGAGPHVSDRAVERPAVQQVLPEAMDRNPEAIGNPIRTVRGTVVEADDPRI